MEAVLVDADSHLAAIGRHNKNNGHLQMGINLTSYAIVMDKKDKVLCRKNELAR